jgi:hypothetical protein
MTGYTSGVSGSERPHPPTISKRPENKKRSPAASDMFLARSPKPCTATVFILLGLHHLIGAHVDLDSMFFSIRVDDADVAEPLPALLLNFHFGEHA